MKTMSKETTPCKVTPELLRQLQEALSDQVKPERRERKNGKKRKKSKEQPSKGSS